jgi:O-acetyl-ADP-ribose deacetylase (regulator of RNase III)
MKLKTVYPIGNKRIELVQGSITEYIADAIVCSANPDLMLATKPGRVQYTLFFEGGSEIFKESEFLAKEYEKQHGPSHYEDLEVRVPLFSAHATSSGFLKKRNIHYVIHSVCRGYPSPNKHYFVNPEVIEKSVKNVLKKCDELKIKSVGFPALGSGVYRVLVEQSALTIAKTSAEYLKGETSLKRLGIVIFKEDDYFAVKPVLDFKFKLPSQT